MEGNQLEIKPPYTTATLILWQWVFLPSPLRSFKWSIFMWLHHQTSYTFYTSPIPPKDLNVRNEQDAVEYQYLMHPLLYDVSCSAYLFPQRAYSMGGRKHHLVPTLEAVRL